LAKLSAKSRIFPADKGKQRLNVPNMRSMWPCRRRTQKRLCGRRIR